MGIEVTAGQVWREYIGGSPARTLHVLGVDMGAVRVVRVHCIENGIKSRFGLKRWLDAAHAADGARWALRLEAHHER